MRVGQWTGVLGASALGVSILPFAVTAQEDGELEPPQQVREVDVCYEYSGPTDKTPDGFRFGVIPAEGTTIGPVGAIFPESIALPFVPDGGVSSLDTPCLLYTSDAADDSSVV